MMRLATPLRTVLTASLAQRPLGFVVPGFGRLLNKSKPVHRLHSTRGGARSVSDFTTSELKRLLTERGVDFRDCLEKSELVARLQAALRGDYAEEGNTALAGLSAGERNTVKLFERVSPSVAFIQTSVVRGAGPLTMRGEVVPQGSGSGFVWDDHLLIEANENIDSLSKIPQMFERDLWEGTPAFRDKGSGYYRPLMTLSLATDHAIFGLNPMGYHLHSLFWHLLCLFLFGRLLKRHLKSTAAVAAGMALFAFHPLQVEAVMFISSRNDLMAGAGLMATLLLLERDRLEGKHLFLGGLCLFLAALCQETVLLAPLILALNNNTAGFVS